MLRTIQVTDEVFQVIEKDARRHETDSDVIARWAIQLGLLLGKTVPSDIPVDSHVIPSKRITRSSPRRIDGFQLFNQYYVVDKWWKLFAKVAEVLITKHPEKQNLIIQSKHVEQDVRILHVGKAIPKTQFYFESTQSAASMLAETKNLLVIFGYDPNRNLIVREHIAGSYRRTEREYLPNRTTMDNLPISHKTTSFEPRIRKNIDWMREIIEYLQSVGGKAYIDQVYSAIYKRNKEVCDSPEYSRSYESSPGSVAWKTRVRAARDYAVKSGYILPPEQSERGLWRLTPKGYNWK